MNTTNETLSNGNGGFNPSATKAQTNTSIEIIDGTIPLILDFRHAGHRMPNIEKMGVSENWWSPESPSRRHEACDWGTQELSDDILRLFPGTLRPTIVRTDISRLYVDLDRIETEAIIDHSVETEQPIPGNQDLSLEETEKRLAFYRSYNKARDDAAQALIEKHGHVGIVAIHSFTEIYRDQRRERRPGVIGTDNPLTRFLTQDFGSIGGAPYKNHHPYDLRTSQTNVSEEVSQRANTWNANIEFPESLLATTELREEQAMQLLVRVYALAGLGHDLKRLLNRSHGQREPHQTTSVGGFGNGTPILEKV